MYSYEDKIRAVELYIKLGKRVKATIRQLGYPTKNALKGWYREHDRRGDLAKAYHRAPKYTIAQQLAALDHFLQHGRRIEFTQKVLGYPCRSVLRSWIYERHVELCQRSVGQSAAPMPLEVKQEAVIVLCTRQGAARAIAQDLGVSRETLYNWKDQLLGREAPASMKRQSKPPADPDKAQVEQQLEALKGELRRLQLEHDLLKKANEILKKDLGVNLQLLTNREKTMLIDALRPAHAVKELLAALCLAPVCRRAPHTLRDLREESSLLRLPQDARVVATDVHLPLGEGCAAPDEAGELNRGHSKAAPIRLVSGRDQSCAGKSDQS